MKQIRIFDCEDEGCGICEVCRYLDHLDRAEACASPGDTIERNTKIEQHLDDKYPHWRS